MSIRIKCSCGARFKAPDSLAGKSVRCSVCSNAVYIPSAGSTSGVALKANAETTTWIRLTCTCGKVIKGPPEWAGKKGNCPRCGKDVVMPAPEAPVETAPPPTPQPQPMPAAAKTDGVEEAVPGRNLRLSGLLDLTAREEVKIVDGVAPAVWTGRRDQRAKNMAASAREQIRYYKQSSIFEQISQYRISWLPFIYNHPAATTVCSLIVLALSLAFLWYQLQPPPPLPQWLKGQEPIEVYFFDLETGEIFAHPVSDPPPILTPKQAAGDKPRGVRAYIYTCSDCSPEKRFVAFYETFNPTTREGWERRIAGRRMAVIDAPLSDNTIISKIGRFVALPTDKDNFISLEEEDARKIVERAYKPCPSGAPPSPCYPGK